MEFEKFAYSIVIFLALNNSIMFRADKDNIVFISVARTFKTGIECLSADYIQTSKQSYRQYEMTRRKQKSNSP